MVMLLKIVNGFLKCILYFVLEIGLEVGESLVIIFDETNA